MSKYTPEHRAAQFWSRVDKSDDEDACWIWTGYVNKDGFGEVMQANARPLVVHRYAFLLTFGNLPSRSRIAQTCGNKLCVNPSHLHIPTVEDRFWVKVDKSAGEHACWTWQGAIATKGYGSFYWGGRIEHAQRVAYMIIHGGFPRQLHVLHTCDNPSCVNPEHLFLGTNQDNVNDKMRKGRQPIRYGESHPHCKLTDKQVSEIRLRYAAGGVTQRALAGEYGVTRTHIGYLINNKCRVAASVPAEPPPADAA